MDIELHTIPTAEARTAGHEQRVRIGALTTVGNSSQCRGPRRHGEHGELGLLMNVNVVAMKNSIKRFVLERSDGILRALRVSVVNFSQ